MIGRVKKYRSDKGFGFIVGVDNQDYFFHNSTVKSFEQPYEGSLVNFLPSQGDRGLVAKDVYLTQSKNKPDIVKFGEERVKLRNIKDYYMGEETVYYQKVYKRKEQPNRWFKAFRIFDYELNGMKHKIDGYTVKAFREHKRVGRLVYLEKGDQRSNAAPGENASVHVDGVYRENEELLPPSQSDLITEQMKYLTVTTYQKESYRFYADQFDVVEKCEELDEYFS